MKQHITPKQLNELSERGKDRLLDIFVKKDVKLMEMIFGKNKEEPDLKYLKETIEHDEENRLLLSVGQMIEFLDEKTSSNWEIRFHKPLYDVNYPDSHISPDFEDFSKLCDALWDAVKEVLEKN